MTTQDQPSPPLTQRNSQRTRPTHLGSQHPPLAHALHIFLSILGHLVFWHVLSFGNNHPHPPTATTRQPQRDAAPADVREPPLGQKNPAESHRVTQQPETQCSPSLRGVGRWGSFGLFFLAKAVVGFFFWQFNMANLQLTPQLPHPNSSSPVTKSQSHQMTDAFEAMGRDISGGAVQVRESS
jgi:hypothetical protein